MPDHELGDGQDDVLHGVPVLVARTLCEGGLHGAVSLLPGLLVERAAMVRPDDVVKLAVQHEQRGVAPLALPLLDGAKLPQRRQVVVVGVDEQRPKSTSMVCGDLC
eukprot:CAMPEP_0204543168 /NCGR_PEP_ID=MMETSP0661-20131031/19553_1 /ASSEMBLY_ACC=CAM_ASM_000606 /TAXON_ID=109239 /ORGANISM="Alexandrium margalefi, Strain AMGDE01CS-322" /LENGTH=105 /DNA_ID=CAMNT_0051549891 /DNA_START=39 /DNA_END=353 /DNA_ORIENTATION=+